MASPKPVQTGRRPILLGTASTVAAASTAQRAIAQSRTPQAPLASWNEGEAKQAILDFVRDTTNPSSRHFVAPEDRIATFDQDGTLWVEHPLYTQAMFALDRVHSLVLDNPEWRTQEPFSTVLSNDLARTARFTERDWAEIVFRTHAGMSQAAFREIVLRWIATAKHPRFKRKYTELIYQPMIELLDWLQVNQFETFIVTGGGQDFVRSYCQRVYGIPTQRVIGSSIATKFEINNGTPELVRLPKLFFNDNYDGKAIGIDLFIGRRPYAAFGNSTGDRQMLEWTGAGDGARLKMLVYHDDPVREYAYGPAGGLADTAIGTFDQSLLDEAKMRSWTVVSMKNDWKRIFAFE
ncbi:MAG TPA: HAD family hydrolase [Bradyrhizobium sp.]|nr:HAD family hydrolase [Bradyrhizobium sp.]